MSTKLEKRLADCLTKRKALLVIQESVEKFIKQYDNENDVYQIPIRLEALDRIYTEFQDLQADIEKYDDAEKLEEHMEERAVFESRFCSAKGFLLMKRSTDPNQSTVLNTSLTANNQPASPSFHLRLPKIELPRFDGDFSRWLSFRDTFTSMVHSNADIPTVAKLQYLLQSLEGEAHKPFESINIEADNYALTWDTLLKRYDNKRYLKRQLFRALYDIPPLKRESPKDDLIDDYQRHVKALAKLKEPVGYWDTPLINLLIYKLDPTTLRAWEEKTSSSDDVTYEQLVDFLYQRVRMLKSVVTDLNHRYTQPGQVKVAGPTQTQKKPFKMVSNSATAETKSYTPNCIACPESHFLFQCPAFSKMSVHQRRELVTQKRLCWNFFRSGHQSRNCTSKYNCHNCHQKHHTLLHETVEPKVQSTSVVVSGQPTQQPIPSTSSAAKTPRSENSNTQISLSVQSCQFTVLLETVNLLVMDSGSMCSFITKKLANTLNLRRTKVDIAVSGIGETSKQIKRKLTATIKSKLLSYSTTLDFLILKKPTVCLPTTATDVSSWKFPEVTLADPYFHIPADIDMIVGGEIYHDLHTGNKVLFGEGQPVFVETAFGWTVTGKVSIQLSEIPRVCHLTTVDRNLEQALQKFWELEAVEPCSKFTTEENLCEELYATTTTRDSSGRYVVSLPLTRDPLVTLGNSRTIAERCLLNLERRFKRDPTTKEAYCRFVEEYKRLNHMVKLVDPVDETQPHCYLPHHPVFKESSITTKIRVVYNASCKTSSGFSVNDLQLVGLVVQEDLLSIHIRFRIHQIAFVADVEKMYRQILLNPSCRRYQLILWRPNPDQPIATYELQTVTYGFASAPFLATRTLQQIALDAAVTYPAAAAAAQRDFYVDDFLSGADTAESAIRIRREMSAMLSAAGFPLRKWASNSPEVLADIPTEDRAFAEYHDLQDDQSVSTLGLIWDPRSDVMRFKVQLPLPAPTLTKRKIMSYVAQIFDQLGLVGPVIVIAKLFMQRLWSLKTDEGDSYEWDRPLAPSLQTEWKEFHGTLDTIATLRIPRCVSLANATSFQLHFFSDASQRAYGVCCYVRSECAESVHVQLLTPKSKVAPLAKPQTIARTSNPADPLSRGVNPVDIEQHSLWWNGPDWLSLPPSLWPVSELPSLDPCWMSEAKTKVAMIATVDSTFSDPLFSRFSSFNKFRRCIAYWMRYFRALKAASKKTTIVPFEYLTTADFREADIALCRLAQRESFPKEISNLLSSDRVATSSPLKWLKPKISVEGIIRVGGRLGNAAVSVDPKFPILLSSKHPLAILLVKYYHHTLLHAGPQLMLATIGQKFWIIGGRNLVRRIYHQCHTCFRSKPVLVQQSIADLPTSRVTPFAICGMDYCGPVYIKSPIRNRAPTKAYIAIFVCFAVRAVHIELVSDLSTAAFLAALRRFVARRGWMSEIHSDNGTAFKGAANKLHRIYEMLKSNERDRKQILDWCAEHEIVWRFIPPRAPHFGGLWEAAVKSAKNHLLREIGTVNITYEDMVTLLAQVEMCLNSRPLVPIPTDPSDLKVLTPGHFLIGTSFQAVPDINLSDIPDNRLTHFELTQKRFQRIWSRWAPEYLQKLQSRATKSSPPVTITPGAVVVIKDDNLPPIQWPLGRITKVHPGKDGVVRVVTLRTATTEAVVRPVAKIALLPMQEHLESVDDQLEHAKIARGLRGNQADDRR
ncbi:uncharacterized protein LOC128735951 [Sabethes cyaneus]|uniref:uncharacterized protein LOC128735951 n=1 Tax=Sabethes cyaneus TaxID=53552 RepID=UPI00237DC6D9|nr:uncharacterized protein LOC128735951 [Sabethes cyaneus]